MKSFIFSDGDLVKAMPKQNYPMLHEVIGIYMGKKWVNRPSEASDLVYVLISHDIMTYVYCNTHKLIKL